MTLSYGDRSEKPTLSYGGMVNLTPLVMEITPKLPILAGGAPYHLHIASAPPLPLGGQHIHASIFEVSPYPTKSPLY